MAISNVFLRKKNVCLSVCLAFFESADARDLGMMTLFFLSFQLKCLTLYSAAQKKVLGLLHVILQVFIDRSKKNP